MRLQVVASTCLLNLPLYSIAAVDVLILPIFSNDIGSTHVTTNEITFLFGLKKYEGANKLCVQRIGLYHDIYNLPESKD